MSFLGLLRLLAEVERTWFRRRFSAQEVPKRYQSEFEPDADSDSAGADRAVVDMSEEYAHLNPQADLLRERLDGRHGQ